MKNNLLDLFIECLSEELNFRKLGLKEMKYNNDSHYVICKIEDSINFDNQLLKEKLSDFYYALTKDTIDVVSHILHILIFKFPEIVFSQLTSLSPFNKHIKGLNDSFPALKCSFKTEDLAIYLANYSEKNLICNNYSCFTILLNKLKTEFKNHKDFNNILLHNFKLHANLIKKADGNLIGTRSWCIENINNNHIEIFEPFFNIEYTKPLFLNLQYNTTIKIFDIKALQSNFVLQDAKGVKRYKEFLRSFTHVLNINLIKKEFKIDKTEGQLVFDNTGYQLTFFHQNNLDNIHLEKNLSFLLKVLCEYWNLNNTDSDNFDNNIFKSFQYHLLNNKLIPLGKKNEAILSKI